MRLFLPRPASILAAALGLWFGSTALSAQKALVVCPPTDTAGCERVAQVLGGATAPGGGAPLFPGGVDRKFDELRTADPAELRSYSLVFVPSFANAPYSLLREDAVRERLRTTLTGRVAVWSGTPDRGSVADRRGGKLLLIERLARWGAGGNGTGLVVLQDFSAPRPDGASSRYDWIEGIAGVPVGAAPVERLYGSVRKSGSSVSQAIVGDLAYDNMASFGLHVPAGAGEAAAFGSGGQDGGPAVLVTFDRSGPASLMSTMAGPSATIEIEPNIISLTNTTNVTVYLFSTPSFDASAVDPATVRFVVDGQLPGAPVATRGSAYSSAVEDKNGDGLPDRRFTFLRSALQAAGLNGPAHQLVVRDDSGPVQFVGTDPTPPQIVDFAPVATVTIVPGSATIAVGGTAALTAELRASNNALLSGRVVTWSSLDAAATVNSSGVVTGQSPGAARIVAASEGKADTAEITVTPASTPPFAVADSYSTPAGTPLTVAAGPNGLLANDTLGTPSATLVSFGGGSIGGSVTSHPAGTSVSFGSGGSLTVNADGSLGFTPAAGFAGTFTFQYRITNTAGSSDATVTIQVTGTAPTAVNDPGYTTDVGATLSVPAVTGVLANDSLGSPTATLTRFGGGSLGGTVTDHGAGSTATFGSGGSLTVNADGSFSFTPAAGFSGSFTFQYRIANAVGSSDATVTIEVQAPPTAVNDGPEANSTPGSPYHAALNTPFNLAAPGILANDARGAPAANVVSFGADSLGGAVTAHPAGSTVSPLPGHANGSLSVGSDGSVSFTPPTDFTGLYVFRYRIQNSRGSSDAQVTIAVGARPVANDDNYTALHGNLVGNVHVNTATGSPFRVTGNDQGDRTTLTLVSQSNGTATLAPDGTFTFAPTPGYEGPASFTYTLTNGFGTTAPATVSLNVSGMIWFVTNGGSAGNGTLATPFNSLAAFHAVNNGSGNNPAAGDHVFLHESGTPYEGPLTLLNGQKLIGQDATASLTAITGLTPPVHSPALPAMASGNSIFVTITSASGNGVTLGQNNALHGLRLGSAPGAALSGSGFGTLTVADVAVSTSGQALSLANGTLSGGFAEVRSTGGTNNVFLSGVATSGTSTLGAGGDALSGATGDALRIDGGNGSFTYAGSITNTATLAVNVANKSGGTVTLSGAINPAAAARGISVAGNGAGTTVNFTGANQRISTGTGTGVSLSGNTGATVNFSGGALEVATSTGNGFHATGGGTVNVTGANNTLASAGGVALNVANTTIGASGLTFRSVAASGGSNGIVLDNTGASAGLTVTGTGTAGSGGTIQNTTGADGTTAGTGVYLNNTRNVSLRWMQLNDHSNFAIRGNNVVGFALARSAVSGTNGTNADQDEASVAFTGLTGSARVDTVAISGGVEDNFRVRNSSGTLDRIVFTGITIGANGTAAGNDGINLEPSGTAVMRATVQNSTFTSARGDLFQLNVAGTASSDLVFTGNTLSNNHPNIVSGGGGVTVVGGGLGSAMTLTYNISGNTFRDARGHGLLVSKVGGAGSMTGTVSNNQIGLAGTANSGSQQGSGLTVLLVGGGTHTAAVTNNQIRQYNNHGILLQGGEGTQGGQGTLNATVTGNTIANPGNFDPGGLAGNGIHLNAGTVDSPLDQHQFCVQLSGNSMTGSGLLGGTDFRLRQRQGTTVRLPGYAGGNTNTAAVVAFVQGNNGGTPTGSVAVNVPPGGGFVGGAACQ